MARILIATPVLDGCLDPLAAHTLIEGEPGSDENAQALICGPMQRVDAAAQARMPHLRVIAVAGAGSDAVDHAAAASRGIPVLTSGEGLVETTADLAFGLIIAASRLMGDAAARLRGGSWRGWSFISEDFGRDVHGATLGLVGFGSIGRAVARRAGGFDMKVLHHTRHRTNEPGWIEDLDELLATSDILSIHVPLHASTRRLIDSRRIGLLRPTAVLVNTARGAVIDEDALAEALHEGRLFAAGVDVYEDEPSVSPRLLTAPRTVLLPHVGSATLRSREAMLRGAAEKVRRFFEG
ncbi:MAG TPA: NAD(P)-dependent oxidoreductase [Solirubrobacteraceae bacterium]|jgi:lactate dehydrogenase-like 2-hydroxyacid dehydrogenase|nr:NAD(P)-dependent oxidoreductase [Solirubrobacteraceae bacterium]